MSRTTSPSIFDLPPIVDTICRHLAPADYQNATLINRTFYSGCRRYLWKDIKIQNLDEEYIPTMEHQEALITNSRWMQELTVHAAYMPVICLLGSRSACSNLRRLRCDLSHELSAYSIVIVPLLECNPQLENLTIMTRDTDPQNTAIDRPQNLKGILDMATAIQSLASLRTLTVETPERFVGVDLLLLLSSLPDSLRTFVYQERYPDEGEETQHTEVDLVEHLAGQRIAWRASYPNLKNLIFSEWQFFNLAPIITPLLRRCPVLVNLVLPVVPGEDLPTIAGVLRDHCPRLRKLSVMGKYEEDQLLPLTEAAPRLAILQLPCYILTSSVFISRLIPKWSSTLTSVTTGAGLCIQSSDIQLLLTSCPHLIDFWMIPLYPEQRPWTIDPHYSALKLSDLVQSEWTCLRLHALGITFHDGRAEQDTLQEHLDQEERTRDLIKQAYAQLGKLTRLRNLGLTWGRPFREGAESDALAIHKPGPLVHMDMSMTSGLSMMSGCKDMTEIYISNLARISMKEEELEWALQEWPKLTTLNGLDERWRNWLRVRKFNLNI
ncbi:hypothetical protein BGX28_003406 [Mortierella sp. GBA30]|nr:hypothetical protein BGX28_003406 [Mortierella sp. GBA30]